ncbi:NAD(P)-dependent oxidoreductase [Micromonospora purpureochromogenes]|uniref:3-hydroxyisobutyrate dehydrogenase/2-hydroxy-3-oxopropionate reductase n=1 Tax=Micromonospora purpureochromogenes TaxID=47872 RepID=A0ABX2RRZ3_9ACTN|nr:NAD(P)-dependent oxidoreductase [Micromonospora purpureochromogenes]NYF59312.1 3-hydroxyisobutyrate dehydrogenase/2-hydroxy-3-oxopropionate reductase [Micromonospora purpureochromogenes]
MATVAVIGLGGMGSRMAGRLLDAGHDLVVWNRTPQRASNLVARGAVAAGSPAEAARRAGFVITMLSGPAALQEVVEGPQGIAAGATASTTLAEMSTVGPPAVRRLAAMLPDGVGLLDAPVLGSVSEAESGSLRIFVGGPEQLAQQWMPLLGALGSPMHVGPLGAGAAAKLVANSTLFGVLAVLGEALALADGLGLPRDIAFKVLSATPVGPQADRRRPAIESDEFPLRFALSLARKDADLVVAAAESASVELPVAAAARQWVVAAQEAGLGDRDYSAVLAHITDTARSA